MRFAKTTLFILLFSFNFIVDTHAQLVSWDKIDTCKIYTDLNLAMKEPSKVYRLHLNRKKYSEIPQEIFLLSNLNDLQLDRNKIKTLPTKINELPFLQRLSVNENVVDSIPPAIFTLKNLRVLELVDNYISTLPDEIEKLQELRILALWDNPIDYYPNALGSLKNLTHLDFLHNQMSYGTQDRILQMIDTKKTKVYFSTPCACEDGH